MVDDDRYQRLNLRIPRDLHARLMEAARGKSHSMNAEIVHRLEQSFQRQMEFPDLFLGNPPYMGTADDRARHWAQEQRRKLVDEIMERLQQSLPFPAAPASTRPKKPK